MFRPDIEPSLYSPSLPPPPPPQAIPSGFSFTRVPEVEQHMSLSLRHHPTSNGGRQNGSSVGILYVHIACTFLHVWPPNLWVQLVLIINKSALEISHKFMKGCVVGWAGHVAGVGGGRGEKRRKKQLWKKNPKKLPLRNKHEEEEGGEKWNRSYSIPFFFGSCQDKKCGKRKTFLKKKKQKI